MPMHLVHALLFTRHIRTAYCIGRGTENCSPENTSPENCSPGFVPGRAIAHQWSSQGGRLSIMGDN